MSTLYTFGIRESPKRTESISFFGASELSSQVEDFRSLRFVFSTQGFGFRVEGCGFGV